MILSRELLRARRRRGKISPLYASEDKQGLARTLTSVFKEHVDRRRGELKEALSSCEELGYNYKLVRGLAAVLEDHCIFQPRAHVYPAEARRAVFEEAGNKVVATEEDRRRVLAAAAFRLGVSAEDVDASLYGDLWDEQILADFDASPPQELLREYNFALTLALLAQAHRIELAYRGKLEDFEELGNALGRCRVHSAGGVSKLTVTRRPSRRAGWQAAALEALLSQFMTSEGWRITAETVGPSRKTYLFELGKESDGRLVTPSSFKRRTSTRTVYKAEPTSRPFGEVIIVDELASRLGVTEAEVRRRLKLSGSRYVDLGGIFIAPKKLRELEKALEDAPNMLLSTMLGILRRLGCRRPLPVLEALGYAVEWDKDRGRSRVYRLRR